MMRLVVAFVVVGGCLLPGCGRAPTVEKESKAERRDEIFGGFSGEALDASKTPPAVKKFFDGFSAASTTGKPAALSKVFDTLATVQLLRRQGAIPSQLRESDATLAKQFAMELAKTFADPISGVRWARFQLRKIRYIKPDVEMMVLGRFWDADGVESKMRWWLIQKDGVWRAYDYESVDLGLRFSTLAGIGFKMAVGNDPAAQKLPDVLTAFQTAASGDSEEALEQLRALEKVKLPPAFDAVRWVVAAGVQTKLGMLEESLKSADRAISVQSDLPMVELIYANNFNQLKRHQDALRHMEKYYLAMGEDADYFIHVGDAKLGLGENEAAVQAYEKGLADNDKIGLLVAGLLRAMPEPPHDRLTAHYRKLTGHADWFVQFAQSFQQAGDAPALAALIAVHKQVLPRDPNLAEYEAALETLRTEKPASTKGK